MSGIAAPIDGTVPSDPMMKTFPNHHQRPYGVGLAYRYPVHESAMAHREEIDLLEISTEDYIIRERRITGDPYQ